MEEQGPPEAPPGDALSSQQNFSSCAVDKPFYLRSTGITMFPRAPPDIKMPFAMARRRLK